MKSIGNMVRLIMLGNMNDLLKDKLQTITNDELLITAIRAVFNERIEKEKPNILDMDDNVLLGEKYRAYEVARQIIEQSFADLMSYKVEPKPVKKFNKAR